jgi:hypothetical protein
LTAISAAFWGESIIFDLRDGTSAGATFAVKAISLPISIRVSELIDVRFFATSAEVIMFALRDWTSAGTVIILLIRGSDALTAAFGPLGILATSTLDNALDVTSRNPSLRCRGVLW